MKRFIIYHGSNKVIEKPIFHFYSEFLKTNPKSLDYGEGFYCTVDLDAAKEWASKSLIPGIVNKYNIDERSLKNIIDLTKNNNEENVLTWLSILLHYRINDLGEGFKERYSSELKYLENNYFKKLDFNNVDVIIGYRADDAYFRFPKEFIKGNISIDSLSVAFKLGDLGKQYVLISKKAFDAIKFIESIEVDETYIEKYKNRIKLANDKYEELEIEDKNNRKGRYILDLLKGDNKNDKRK